MYKTVKKISQVCKKFKKSDKNSIEVAGTLLILLFQLKLQLCKVTKIFFQELLLIPLTLRKFKSGSKNTLHIHERI